MTHFSSETLRFVRRVKGSKGPGVAVQQFRDAPPVFLMRMDTYQSRQRYKAGLKPKRTAAARMRMTFWRDETQDVVGLAGKRHAKLWLKKTLCFDGYSTATFFEKRRKAFISKHATPGKDFQCYSEELVVPDFKDYGIWSKPRNILIGSLPYLICTFGGVSWFYRMFVECATSPFEVEVFKMVSNNDHTKRLANKSKRWRLVSAQHFHALVVHERCWPRDSHQIVLLQYLATDRTSTSHGYQRSPDKNSLPQIRTHALTPRMQKYGIAAFAFKHNTNDNIDLSNLSIVEDYMLNVQINPSITDA